MENNVPFQFHIFSTKWNGSGIEKEWKRIGKKQILSGIQIRWNGEELERKWNGKLIIEKANKKWNGDGMEKKIDQVELNIDGMEWRGKGNGMEKVGEQ